MNLPVIIDIIIGLVFIYLTLSLLASEIQELIATVLQWRAQHLKQSIEVLIAGDNPSEQHPDQVQRVRKFANLIYANPIVSDLNQRAKGHLLQAFRSFTHQFGKIYRMMTRTHNVFGNKSTAPSYIPSESFSTSLLDSLKIDSLMKYITEVRLEKFKNLLLTQIQAIADNLPESTKPIVEKELEWLTGEFNKVVEDYKNNLGDLNNSLERMSEKLGFYINDSQVYLPETEVGGREFQRQMGFVKASFDSEFEREALRSQLQPSLSSVFNTLRKVKKTRETVAEILELKEDSPIYKEIQTTMELMPESLKDSLCILAERAEKKGTNTQKQLQQFKLEIETWFDRSMDRATGVYKRNSRGFAIFLGTAIAVGANADTIDIMNRLSKDAVLRSTVNVYAQQLVEKNAQTKLDNLTSLAKVQNDVDRALDRVSLPLGWSEANRLETNGQKQVLWASLASKICGWILSGVAISMGAGFWFDFLNKFINIRNAGKKPPSSIES